MQRVYVTGEQDEMFMWKFYIDLIGAQDIINPDEKQIARNMGSPGRSIGGTREANNTYFRSTIRIHVIFLYCPKFLLTMFKFLLIVFKIPQFVSI